MTIDDPSPSEEPGDVPADVIATRLARRRLFARHLASCNNGAKAARLAGTPVVSAANQAWRWMQEPEVQAMVAEARAERAAKLNVTEERIIEIIASIANGDVREVVKWDASGVSIVHDSDTLTDDEAMMVAGIVVKERTDKEGNTTVTTDVKLQDRLRAVDMLARIKSMYRDKVDIEVTGGVADEMAELRRRRAERLAASNRARPIDAVVIDGEINPGEGAATQQRLDVEPAAPLPGIARRFAAATPRDPDA